MIIDNSENKTGYIGGITMEIIKEKLIGTYVFSIDEATVKGDHRGSIWFSSTPDINIGDETMSLHFDRSKTEILCEYDFSKPAFANEYGEYIFRSPIKIGSIITGEDKKIPYIQFLDDKGNVIFKTLFVFSFTNGNTYCIDFDLYLSKELRDQRYAVISDVLTNEPYRELKYIRCKECGKLFALTKNEIEWFNKKKFSLPKRCENCRNKRKIRSDLS